MLLKMHCVRPLGLASLQLTSTFMFVCLILAYTTFGRVDAVMAVGRRSSPSAAPLEDWPCGVAGSGFATEQVGSAAITPGERC